MAEESAREIERRLQLPTGWMDTDHCGNYALSPTESSFIAKVEESLAEYVVPEHIRETILLLITTCF